MNFFSQFNVQMFMCFIYLKENKTIYLEYNKDVLFYLDSFDENNMFALEHKSKLLYDVSEVLRNEMNRRGIKYNLNYCEDAILNLIDLTVKMTDMINLKKTWYVTRY